MDRRKYEGRAYLGRKQNARRKTYNRPIACMGNNERRVVRGNKGSVKTDEEFRYCCRGRLRNCRRLNGNG